MNRKEEFLQSCLILDTETTGKDYKTAEIIESGFVIREDSNWVIFQELHKPKRTSIPPAVSAICYIIDEMVVDKSHFVDNKEVFQTVVDGYANGYLVGHNYFYDMKVLQNHGVDTSSHVHICTWRMAKKLYNGVDSIEEMNLPYLRFALNLDVPLEMLNHRAGNDSFITGRLLEFYVDTLEESGMLDKNMPYGPQIAEWASAPIIYETWPIGTHKGKKFSEIPKSYWSWAINNIDGLNSEKDNYDNDLYQSLMKFLDSE